MSSVLGPGPGPPGLDEALVARLANELFQGRELTDEAASAAEGLDSVPGRAGFAVADLTGSALRGGTRNGLPLGEALPSPAASLPGAGMTSPRPAGALLRSAPVGAELPGALADPWEHLSEGPWALLDATGRGVAHPVVHEGAPMESWGPAPEVMSALLPAAFAVPREPAYSHPVTPEANRSSYDVGHLRDDFPVLRQRVHGKPLVWLDNAATTQKPQCVIDRLSSFYEHDNSNVHRGAHELAARATDAYEGTRATVARFLGATSPEEVVFVRGTTEALNLVAQSYGRSIVGAGDEIVVTTLEHHANIVPWLQLARERGAVLRPVPIDDRGCLLLDAYAAMLGPRTKIVALAQVSNALGTVLPVPAMAAMAHAVGATVVVDGAQGVPHMPVDVHALGADFFAFSGHKVYGPTGTGALWGRRELLEAMPPWQTGGQMIKTVTFESTTWNDVPYKFEAGTGAIGPVVGLGAALDYVQRVGPERIANHEHALLEHATRELSAVPGLRIIGTAPVKAGVVSFVLEGTQPEDVGKFLDGEGIAVRAGHHCAQPALRHFGLSATVRPSFGLYNTHDDVEVLAAAVRRASRSLRR